MAAAIFDALADERSLNLLASSAGVAAFEGAPMDQKARAALEEIGIYPEAHHQARQVSRELLEDAELVLAMTPRHVAQLRRNFESSKDTVG